MWEAWGQWLSGKEQQDEDEEEDRDQPRDMKQGQPGPAYEVGEQTDEQRLREISLEYDNDVLKEATQNFAAGRRLGSGNYGCVYRGTLPDGHEVAIKVLEIDADNASICGFADEVRVLSKFRHPNLVTLMGWGIGDPVKGKNRRFLVYELLSGGDVSQRLAACRPTGTGRPFLWGERLWVALDASCGLSHMHNSTPKAFHRDIKSANILLDRSGTAKMADFGLSGIAKNKEKLNMTCEQIAGTPGYACPHYIKSGKVTERTEVYAFGMVMLELLLNSMPACLGKGGNIVYPIFQVVQPMEPGALDRALGAVDVEAQWPPGLAREVATFALKCSDMNIQTRPLFTEVSRKLRHFCDHYCQNQRAPPPTDPKLNWSSSAAISLPTRQHQQGPNGLGGGGGAVPTRPQMQASSSGGPPTRPQLPGGNVSADPAPTRPQLGVGQGAVGPSTTRPQLGAGQASHSVGAPTRPQLQPDQGAGGIPTRPQLPSGQAPPTRPQLPSDQSANGGCPTRPQLSGGAGGAATRPQLGGWGGPTDSGSTSIPTWPQMQDHGDVLTRPQLPAGPPNGSGLPTQPQVSSEGGGNNDVPTRFDLAAGAGGGGGPPTRPQLGGLAGAGLDAATRREDAEKFAKLVRELWQTGWEVATEGQVSRIGASGEADVVLECLSAKGVDVARFPLKHKCLALRPDGPWNIGRMQQPNLFSRLVPEESLRGSISRSHLTISYNKTSSSARLKKLAANVTLVDGRPVPPGQEVPLPNGALIGFCGEDNLTTFLVFRALVRDANWSQQPESSQPAAAPVTTLGGGSAVAATVPQVPEMPAASSPSPNGWWFAGPSRYSLVCVMAYGHDIKGFPVESRTVGLQTDGEVTIGRLHQPGYFEGLLGAEASQRYLCCVSRGHLEIGPVRGGASGMFEVINNSTNPVQIVPTSGSGPRKLGKNDSTRMVPGDLVEFIGNAADGSGAAVVFLRLKLLSEAPEYSSSATAPTQAVVDTLPASAAGYAEQGQRDRGVPERTPDFPSAAAAARGFRDYPREDAPDCYDPRQRDQDPRHRDSGWDRDRDGGRDRNNNLSSYSADPHAASSSSYHPEPRRQDRPEARAPPGPPFWIILSGSAVRRDFPASERRLDGGPEGLTVGRAHQQALHSNAFGQELRQYLSRDHFRIDWGREGCRLVPLSSNPIWRFRGGRMVEAIVGQPPLSLVDGDELLLFTGASDCTPDGPGNLGLLSWSFHEGQSNSSRADATVQALRRSPYDQGPEQRGGSRSKSPRRAHFGASTSVARETSERYSGRY